MSAEVWLGTQCVSCIPARDVTDTISLTHSLLLMRPSYARGELGIGAISRPGVPQDARLTHVAKLALPTHLLTLDYMLNTANGQ